MMSIYPNYLRSNLYPVQYLCAQCPTEHLPTEYLPTEHLLLSEDETAQWLSDLPRLSGSWFVAGACGGLCTTGLMTVGRHDAFLGSRRPKCRPAGLSQNYIDCEKAIMAEVNLPLINLLLCKRCFPEGDSAAAVPICSTCYTAIDWGLGGLLGDHHTYRTQA